MASLKSANAVPYAAFLIANLALFGGLITLGVPGDAFELVKRAAAPGTVACVLALALNAFIPAWLKHVLVFWRVKDVLPGHRAFSELLSTDSRIDVARLKEKCGGAFPAGAAEQNTLWYRLLNKHEQHPAVADAHRRFLALRDMATSAPLLALFFALAAGILKVDAMFYPVLITVIGIEYLFLRVGAVNEAERLVCNVLAREAS
jgi:hypothetical protein